KMWSRCRFKYCSELKACFFIFLPLTSIIIKNWKLGNYGVKKGIKKIRQTLAQNSEKRYHKL
ncbi:MAG: hypothetical protein E6318_06850, partial [Streptococcus mitis]|nr:hypothetical protein [Streptococcus mitis]